MRHPHRFFLRPNTAYCVLVSLSAFGLAGCSGDADANVAGSHGAATETSDNSVGTVGTTQTNGASSSASTSVGAASTSDGTSASTTSSEASTGGPSTTGGAASSTTGGVASSTTGASSASSVTGTASTGTSGAGGASTQGTTQGSTDAGGNTSTESTATEASSSSETSSGTTGGTGEDCVGGSEVDFSLIGWATEAGGTSGGKGGTSVTVSTGSELQEALKAKQDSATPLTILVDGVITPENSGDLSKIDVKEVSDVSIIGTGAGAEFNGIGIKVFKASNIILRNLRVHHVLIGDKDAISIEGPADHIWVDHCELYAEYQGVDKDYYDGLLDVKAEAEYITYSWNYLHDSWKTSLVGSSETDTFDRKLTMHHNYFKNDNSRLPLFRGGNGHVFNNLYEDIESTAVNSRLGACLRVENNYFEGVLNPWVSAYSDVLGAMELICNVTTAGSAFDYSADDTFEPLACTGVVPYSYASALNHVNEVPNIVREHAGVGKLSDPTDY